jgi:hypothetical protein
MQRSRVKIARIESSEVGLLADIDQGKLLAIRNAGRREIRPPSNTGRSLTAPSAAYLPFWRRALFLGTVEGSEPVKIRCPPGAIHLWRVRPRDRAPAKLAYAQNGKSIPGSRTPTAALALRGAFERNPNRLKDRKYEPIVTSPLLESPKYLTKAATAIAATSMARIQATK